MENAENFFVDGEFYSHNQNHSLLFNFFIGLFSICHVYINRDLFSFYGRSLYYIVHQMSPPILEKKLKILKNTSARCTIEITTFMRFIRF